jgi:hypothetical protein
LIILILYTVSFQFSKSYLRISYGFLLPNVECSNTELHDCVLTESLFSSAAIQSLKRKKMYEQQIEQLGNFQLRIHDQMIMLEAAKATTETVDALRTGAKAMKAMQKAT